MGKLSVAKVEESLEPGPLQTLDSGLWEPPTLDVWLTEVADEGRWLIPGFIPEDGLCLLSGHKKRAMKTYSALTQAICLAAGIETSLLKPIAAVPTLFIEEEGGKAETKERVLGICRALEIPVEDKRLKNLYFSHRRRTKLDDDDWRAGLVSLVKRRSIKVVYLDALVYMHSADENKVSEMSPVLETMQMMREAGATVVYMCHLDKSRGEDRKSDLDSQVRGAGILTDAYDVHLAYRRYKMSDNHIDLTVRQRSAGEEYYTVAWDIANHKEGDRDVIDYAKLSMVGRVDEHDKEKSLMAAFEKLEIGRVYSKKDCADLWNIGNVRTTAVMTELLNRALCQKNGAGIEVTG